MSHQVLVALRAHKDYVSGQLLSSQLGISRVAVWKQVRALRSLGYVIRASRRGYLLESSPDLLLPLEFPGWEPKVHHLMVADSTMHTARTLARRGAREGTLVIAEQQSAGRGRLDRSWLSPAGGIYLTIVTRPAITPVQAPRINLMAAVAVADAIERLFGLRARVKWPNDVLVGGRKVCGILAEMEAECDAVRFVNVGIGLNANSRIADVQDGAVSLLELLGSPVDRTGLVRAIVEGVLSRLRCLADSSIIEEWKARTVTIGREVCVVSGGMSLTGIAVGINSWGALLVRGMDGRMHEVVAGDCVHAGH